MNYCIDCGKEISKYATRCKSCEIKRQHIKGIRTGYFKKGKDNPNYGGLIDEHKRKISETLKGNIPWNKNKRLSKKHKQHISESKRGRKIGSFSKGTKKKMSENHADVNGLKNPNWKGGISFEPYSSEFNKQLKEHIKERDNYICQLCGNVKSLCIHHIDYNKKSNNIKNLITLCNYCHGKTNFNRRYWEKRLNAN